MAGRVPVGSQRIAVAQEMENTFIQNLRYAADVLSKVGDVLGPTGSDEEEQVSVCVSVTLLVLMFVSPLV